jgi:uncharacterized protein YggE
MRKSLFAACVAALIFTLGFAARAAAQGGEVGKEITIEGRLARTVEAGGWLIVADYGKYLILNSRQFQSEPWFREGASVVATGEARQGAVTVYQEGMPFQARTMRARAANGGSRPGNNKGSETASNNQGSGQADTPPASAGRNLTRVVVTGDATVSAQPDTATLTVAVVTTNASASEAQAENASKSDAVVRAVKAAAGAGAEVRTSDYSLQPEYTYTTDKPPAIRGYVARNAVTVTTGALDRVGPTIDAASRAGANNVDRLAFTLRRDESARAQALTSATTEALSKARVLAGALGGRLVRVVEVQEGGVPRPVPLYAMPTGRMAGTAQATTPTPVEAGPLEIRAEVTLVAEVETKE